MKTSTGLIAAFLIIFVFAGCAGDNPHYTPSQRAAQRSEFEGPY